VFIGHLGRILEEVKVLGGMQQIIDLLVFEAVKIVVLGFQLGLLLKVGVLLSVRWHANLAVLMKFAFLEAQFVLPDLLPHFY
jgi:hypothetical protein